MGWRWHAGYPYFFKNKRKKLIHLIYSYFFLLKMTRVVHLLTLTWHLKESVKYFFFWHISWTFEFTLLRYKTICNLNQSHKLILHLSQNLILKTKNKRDREKCYSKNTIYLFIYILFIIFDFVQVNSTIFQISNKFVTHSLLACFICWLASLVLLFTTSLQPYENTATTRKARYI